MKTMNHETPLYHPRFGVAEKKEDFAEGEYPSYFGVDDREG
jgi:hypothetical protein